MDVTESGFLAPRHIIYKPYNKQPLCVKNYKHSDYAKLWAYVYKLNVAWNLH
jgi:hypothetical protein